MQSSQLCFSRVILQRCLTDRLTDCGVRRTDGEGIGTRMTNTDQLPSLQAKRIARAPGDCLLFHCATVFSKF